MPEISPHSSSRSATALPMTLAITGWGLMFAAYATLFITLGQGGVVSGLQRALFNTLPAALLSWPFARLIERHLIDAGRLRQGIGHFALALTFAVFWYIGLQVGYGLQNGLPADGIVGRALSGIALTWQVFQGVTLYAVIALFTYAVRFHERWQAAEMRADRVSEDMPLQARRILVKDGKALRPVAIADILCLSGAGDYTHVVTQDETILSSATLSQFEADLPSDNFLRVHRSHIVATDAIRAVEPGGNGRLTLHLSRGHSVTTSRAGAALLKDRAL